MDMMLYRLKSAGHDYVAALWKTLLHLARRLALDKLPTLPAEFSMLILRPLYITSSIIINIHGADGLMQLCVTEEWTKTPLLLELALKFLIRGILLFPPWTFSIKRTAEFFIKMSLAHSVSVIRRASLEGMKALCSVRRSAGEDVKGLIERLLGDRGEGQHREARLAFLYSVEQLTSAARVDGASESVQLWLDVRDRGCGPELPSDVAWVALAGDEFLQFCVRDLRFWSPITGVEKVRFTREFFNITDFIIDRSIDRLIDWLIDWLIDCINFDFVDWLIHWSINRLIDWLIRTIEFDWFHW